MDNRNNAEREFDASVMTELDKWTDAKMTRMASPDGLGKGTGRWWLIHDCPTPKTTIPITEDGKTSTDIVSCKGCGQRVEFKAFKSDFDHPDVQWTFEAHMKKAYPPDGIPPWADEMRQKYE